MELLWKVYYENRAILVLFTETLRNVIFGGTRCIFCAVAITVVLVCAKQRDLCNILAVIYFTWMTKAEVRISREQWWQSWQATKHIIWALTLRKILSKSLQFINAWKYDFLWQQPKVMQEFIKCINTKLYNFYLIGYLMLKLILYIVSQPKPSYFSILLFWWQSFQLKSHERK